MQSVDGLPGLESAFACERVPKSVFDEVAEVMGAVGVEGDVVSTATHNSDRTLIERNAGVKVMWGKACMADGKFMHGVLMGVTLAVLYNTLRGSQMLRLQD